MDEAVLAGQEGLRLAQEVYPSGAFEVDFSRAMPGRVIAVRSECEGVPDYYVTTLMIDGYLAALVSMTIKDGVGQAEMINPIGPAFTGAASLAPHGQVRDVEFPPVSISQAAEIAGVSPVAALQSVEAVYACPNSDARPLPIDFYYDLGHGGRDGMVSALEGNFLPAADEAEQEAAGSLINDYPPEDDSG